MPTPLHVCMYRMDTCSVNAFNVILPRMKGLGMKTKYVLLGYVTYI